MKKNLFAALSISLLMIVPGVQAQKTAEPPFSKTTAEVDALFKQGLRYYDQGDLKQARKLFAEAIQKDPANTSAMVYNIGTARTSKEFMDDLNKMKTKLATATEWDKMMFQLFESGVADDYNARLAIAQKMVAAYPNAARAYIELGNTYTGAAETAKAREAFMKASKLDPNWVAPNYQLAGSYLFDEPKDFRQAQRFAEKAHKLSPTSAGIEILLGDVYRAQKNLEKARTAYSEAIKLQSDNPDGYYKRGHANTFLGNMDDARKDYLEGNKLDDVPGIGAQSYAYTYLYDNDFKSALQSLKDEERKIDDSKVTNVEMKLNLLSNAATIALHNNDADQLAMLLEKMAPFSKKISDEFGSKERSLLMWSEILKWKTAFEGTKGNFTQAQQLAEELRNTIAPINNPRKYETYSALQGLIHFKQGKYDQAVYDFQQANRNNVYDRYWLAKSYEAAGSKEQAQDIYKEIADNNFNSVGYALIRNEVKKKLMQ